MLDAVLPGVQEKPGRTTELRAARLKGALYAQKGEVGPLKRAGFVIGAISKKLVNALLWGISHRSELLSARARFRLLRVLLSRELEWLGFVKELTLREIYDGAAARCAPKPLAISPVILVRPQKGESEDTPHREIYVDETLGWSAVAQGLVIVDVAGGHITMLQERFVDSLAEALMPYLQLEAAPTRESRLEVALI
jgi:hypothetical protein